MMILKPKSTSFNKLNPRGEQTLYKAKREGLKADADG